MPRIYAECPEKAPSRMRVWRSFERRLDRATVRPSGFATEIGDSIAASDPLPAKGGAVLGRSAWHVICSP
jgi:hypothetical protein